MSLRNLLFSSQGRVSRSTFWFHFIGSQIVLFIGALPLVYLNISGKDIQNYFGILFIYQLVFVLFYITIGINVGIKRFHDRNKSGGFILLSFIPIANLWVLIELGFLRGTIGENQYGPDLIAEIDTIQKL
jgi:uncharacterized membrane protein YhaH (DUF805 family)